MAQGLATLLNHYGRQNWWPAETPFEVAIGAVLVQNTNWRNAAMAIDRIREAQVLSEEEIHEIEPGALEELIRPAGFFRQKAATFKRLTAVLSQHGSIEQVLARETSDARSLLLQVRGIGPETADSILLYAGGHEIFVVDIYLRRWLARQDFTLEAKFPYERLRECLQNAIRTSSRDLLQSLHDAGDAMARHHPSRMSSAPRSSLASLYAESHAVLVANGIAQQKARRVSPGRVKAV